MLNKFILCVVVNVSTHCRWIGVIPIPLMVSASDDTLLSSETDIISCKKDSVDWHRSVSKTCTRFYAG